MDTKSIGKEMVNQAFKRLGEFRVASNGLTDFVIGLALAHLIRDVRHMDQPAGQMSLQSIRQEFAGFATANDADEVLFAIGSSAGEFLD